ncbi:hypothetical protein PHYBOEH_006244 [Phytophthora boehmeriae]|uniref:RRM domain-containing protein n=1 Tax=Phytophthora boehmeriae TaxID=109152 RepID=A0A8T1X4R1_9STRA|nr:hypothetical protein PHYBOEH_006244 [Phytophthora boehmeriae]
MADTTKLGKIFIGGLSYETTDEKLRAYFGAYGTVTDAVVMKDPISRRSRGFGFITYADPVCVDRALAQPNHILDSRRVEAKRAVPRAESLRDIGNGVSSNRGNGTNTISSLSMNSAVGATKKIFVGGLHYETKDADFKKYFMQYGKVVSAEVMFNRETNKSRGFGFVIFESEDSVELVLQDKNHIIDGKSVEVKRAVPRTDVPPPRSVSSRGGSFSGPSGPGSVGSLDDINATPPVSLSGSMPSTSGLAAAMGSEKLSRASSASANIMSNGTLVGYAAAVRYGGRVLPKTSSSNAMTMASTSSVTSPRPLSSNGDGSVINGINLETSTISGVADALSSLVLGDDPVIEQWKLSPSVGPQLSTPEIPLGSPSESSFLPQGLVDDANESSNLSWKAAPWEQQSWGSPPLQQNQQSLQQQQQPPLPPAPAPFFSMFSNQRNGAASSSAWHTNGDNGYGENDTTTSPGGDGFSGGMMGMGMGLGIDRGFGSEGAGRGAFASKMLEDLTDLHHKSIRAYLLYFNTEIKIKLVMGVVEWEASDAENHWRRTFCQLPFSAIYEHADKGKRSLQGLVAFFRRKAEAERGASEQLRALLLDELGALEEPGSGVRRALLELRGFVDNSCRQQLLMAQVLDDQVAGPLESLQDASNSYIHTLQGEILNANKEYEEAAAVHKAAADRLRKASQELREAKDRQRLALHGIGVPEFELQRLAARVAKCEEEQAQAVMARARAKTTLYNRIIARDEMTMAVSVAYQKAEEERLDQLNASLQRFLHVEKERLQVSQQMLASLETHVKSLSRAEDIQLLIHNRRDPDNMHFQGKALALLDWQWSKMQADQAVATRRHPISLLERRSSLEDGSLASPTSSASTTASSSPVSRRGPAAILAAMESVSLDSPHSVLTQTPMSIALSQYFAGDVPGAKFRENGFSDVPGLPPPPPSAAIEDIDTLAETVNSVDSQPQTRTSTEDLVRETCKTADGRALFVKCLNRQRSLETKVKDHASFEALVACFDAFLDDCVREDDIKAAKTAMILAETFYVPKLRQDGQRQANGDGKERPVPLDEHYSHMDGDEEKYAKKRNASLCADCRVYSERTSEELLQYVDETHPLLHGGGIGRGVSRTYLQEEVKKHAIWKTPSFWEKALLLAIGEELQRTPQPCPWEDLPSGVPKHDGLPSREEAVCRVHNIVFGQLGSFTLSMLEFEVSLPQIESFVETMCDAHELTEDQRFLLRKNLQEIFATLR